MNGSRQYTRLLAVIRSVATLVAALLAGCAIAIGAMALLAIAFFVLVIAAKLIAASVFIHQHRWASPRGAEHAMPR
jgi:hypothetical protein